MADAWFVASLSAASRDYVLATNYYYDLWVHHLNPAETLSNREAYANGYSLVLYRTQPARHQCLKKDTQDTTGTANLVPAAQRVSLWLVSTWGYS